MKLHRLTLADICQHRDLVCDFGNGLNGIIGPNGSGKSNTLKAIQAAITGEFDNAGLKTDNIYSGPGAGKGPSSITLHFSHGDAQLVVTRGFRGCATSLVIDGGAPIDGETRVNAAIAEQLGTNIKLCKSYIFVPQGKIADFIDQKNTELSATFQALFGTSQAAKVYKLLGDVVGDIVLTDHMSALRDATADEDRLRRECERLIAEIAQYDDVADYDAATDPNAQLIALAAAQQEHRDEIARLTVLWSEGTAKLTSQQRVVAGLKTQMLTFSEAAKQAAAAAAVGAKLVEAAKQWDIDSDALFDMRDELAKLKSPVCPEPLDEYVAVDQLSQDMGLLDEKINTLQRFVATFNVAADECDCPTCGSRVSGLQDRLDVAKAALVGLHAQQEVLRRLKRCVVNYDTAKAKYDTELAKHQATVASKTAAIRTAETRLGRRPDDTTAVRDAEASAAAAKRLSMADSALKTATAELNRLRGVVTTNGDAIRRRQDQLVEDIHPEQLVSANLAVAQVQVRNDTRNTLYGQWSQCDVEHRQALQRLTDLQAEVARDQQQADWRRYLTEMRNIVHAQSLPRLVSMNHLQLLTDDVNDILSVMDQEFTVSVEEDLRFTARFNNGSTSSASRLSGGQKVLLAIAFRVAVNSAFTGDLGLLCLDEPTEFLDAHNIGALRLALQKLRDLSASRGLQCLMVTHERRLMGLFDNVINLAG